MRKSWGIAAGIAAAALVAAAPGVALAQPTPPTPNGDTTTTFTVGATGTLSISAPLTANLSTIAGTTVTPGGTLTAALGTVTVTDNLSLADTGWTAQVSSTDFTTAGGTIPASDLAYRPGTIATLFGLYTGLIGTNIAALSGTPQTAVTASGANGDNQASWDPTIIVSVPDTAVAGSYSGVITHSLL